MEIDSTPLIKDAELIMNSGMTTANMGWAVDIHFGKENYTPIQAVAVVYTRDYIDAFADEVLVTVQMPLGVYSRQIYPNRLNLEITLSKVPMDEISDAVNTEKKIESERFSAVLIDHSKSPTIAQGAESNNQEALDLAQIINVNFQVYDKALEQLRVMITGTVCRKTTVQESLLTILTNQAATAIVDKNRAVVGIEMIEADNKDVKGQIVIKQGTLLIDTPDFMQSRIGVYNAGIGSYIQNKYWYIYPIYNAGSFNKRAKTLTVLVLPKRKFSHIERTFKVNGKALTILATGETGFKDDAGRFYLNHGNGVRFSDASALMDCNSAATDNKLKLNRNSNNSEFTSDTIIGNINNAPLSADNITSNPFRQYSLLASRNGGMFKCVWENSDSSIIIPGMVAKIVYSDLEEIKTIYGVVHKSTSVNHKAGGFGNNKFKNQTVLDIFVNSQLEPI